MTAVRTHCRLLALLSFVLLLLMCAWSASAADDQGGAPGVDQHGGKPKLPPLPQGLGYTDNPLVFTATPDFLNGMMMDKGMFVLPGYIFVALQNDHTGRTLVRPDHYPLDPKKNIAFDNETVGITLYMAREDGKPIPDGTVLGTCAAGPAIQGAPDDDAPVRPTEPRRDGKGKDDDQSLHL